MNIIEIYNKYHLPENLQMHMLRVASCCNLILDKRIYLRFYVQCQQGQKSKKY